VVCVRCDVLCCDYHHCREQNAEGEKAHMLRFVKLLLGLLIIIHWLGCVYIALGYLRGFNTEWLPEPDVKEMSMSSQYLYGIFWSANILTGVGGEPERPTNDLERVITLLITLIAMFVVAIIIGNVSELVSEANVNDEKFRQKVCVSVCVCVCVVCLCLCLCCVVLCCVVLCYVVLYCVVLCCIVLYCVVLCCVVLYCVVLCCIVLYCILITYHSLPLTSTHPFTAACVFGGTTKQHT